MGLGDVPANALGYGCGLGLSFLLNRRWTFKYEGPFWPAMVKFLMAVGVAYLANLGVVIGAIGLGVNDYIAQTLGVPIYTTIAYALSGQYVFPRRTRRTY